MLATVFFYSQLIILCSLLLDSYAIDTIAVNTSLTDGGTVISSGERFELGFFTPAGRDDNCRYVGIWYYNLDPITVIWVANREKPLLDTGGRFIVDDGNLKVLDESGKLYWSTGLETPSDPRYGLRCEAKLRDSGNLVLSNQLARTTWQSFEHPTDTFLPGMRMDQNLMLTSWTSKIDPAPGQFTFKLHQKEKNQFTIWNHFIPHWISGISGEFFESEKIPHDVAHFLLNLNINKGHSSDYNSIRVVMSFSGEIQSWNLDMYQHEWSLEWWEPKDRCSVYEACGSFGSCNSNNKLLCKCLPGFKPKIQEKWNMEDFSDGCTKNSTACDKDDIFLNLKMMKVYNTDSKFDVKNETECRDKCLSSCQCHAYSYTGGKNSTRRDIGPTNSTCWIWTEDLKNLQEEYLYGGHDLFVRVSRSDIGSSTRKKPLFLIIGVTIASVIVLLCAIAYICICICKRKKERSKNIERNAAILYGTEKRVKDMIESEDFKEEDKKGIDIPFFDLDSILAATDNFSDVNKLGRGGFGPVYKGIFPGGREIAIKRLSSVSGQGLEEFKNEVVLIARLQHRNLVRLLDQKLSILLKWEMRFDIILGVARGLLYLHQDSRLRIIHRDLKTSNILLDAEMNPKISDFGLARIFEGKQTEGSTSRVVGTYGYMSPEYALDGLFSVKSDVFSFGVVVLEILSGRRSTGVFKSGQGLNLLGYAWRMWIEDKAVDFMDETLSGSCKRNEFVKCLHIALLCVQEDPADRPTMSTVVVMLSSTEPVTFPTPNQPAFVERKDLSTTASSSSKQEIITNWTATFGGDTITKNGSIRDDSSEAETLVSVGEKFELGFFTPNGSSGIRRYVGIWYYMSNPLAVVWVANRDNPLLDYDGVFSIAEDGNLKVLDGKGRLYWSTNLDTNSSLDRKTKLMDTGNLVVSYEDEENVLERITWQSFDNPTDTFLPGMKMDENMALISWKSYDDPASGNFTFRLDQESDQFVIWKRSIRYWKSGVSGKVGSSNQMPSSVSYFLSNFTSTVSHNDSVPYLTSSLYIDTRMVMSFSGQIQYLKWDSQKIWTLFWAVPRTRCSLYNACGNFGSCNSNNEFACKCLPGFQPTSPEYWNSGDYSGGCTRKSPLCSSNAASDSFLNLKMMKVGNPDSQFKAKSEQECKAECLNNCQCQAFSYEEAENEQREDSESASCWIWLEDLTDLQEEYDGGRNLNLRISLSDIGGHSNKQRNEPSIGNIPSFVIICIAFFSVIVFLVLSSAIVCMYLQRKRWKNLPGNRGTLQRHLGNHLYGSERVVKDIIDSGRFNEDESKAIDVPFFDLESISAATNKFSNANKLGQGGFGPVYKATYPGGEAIAVKRLSSCSGQGLEEFKNEVVLIAKLQHRNLVRLLGYCVEGNEKMLLYEYMPNKSLDSFIFDRKLCVLLNWEMRYNIIVGIARGLLYLHQDSRLRIIHRDLKTSNILLDEEMNPKISDFGLARIFGGKETAANTNRVVGTYGYIAPEYALDGLFSFKSDVFSFGVVVLEIISGKRNTGFYQPEKSLSLLGYWNISMSCKKLLVMPGMCSKFPHV
ncbi:serine-threonine protein kinase, plant-type, putative [Ricinus communis]|uniref:non-specific serine/threonine protein kinase n=1 Tax=Ricinus communis TaxID=3988 RepID=B9S9P6_RICCO|nr:serine-threonine protein kinase, plant-type, putative [Ricinus communis]